MQLMGVDVGGYLDHDDATHKQVARGKFGVVVDAKRQVDAGATEKARAARRASA